MVDAKKVDEKHIKEIRDFQKSSPSNRRCFDCNELGPQYVCLDFNTFICTTCSGLHREFSHRIKSISMSSFTDTEVTNIIKRGGNDVAQKFWLARFDVNTQPSSHLNARDRIRNFIRDTYIDRRWVYEEPKKEVVKKEAPKPVKQPVATSSDFNPFQLPPPTANHQTSAAFGDFSSFNSTASSSKVMTSPAPASPAAYGDFSQFNSTASFKADISQFATTTSAFEADFTQFGTASPAKAAPVDFFASPPRGNNTNPFGCMASIDTEPVPANSFATLPSTPVKTTAAVTSPAFPSIASPAPGPRDPFASSPAYDPFAASFASPQVKRVDPFAASFSSPQVKPAADPFAASFASPPAKHDSFAAGFATPPAKQDPFGTTSSQPAVDPFAAFDAPARHPHAETATVSTDPFGAFDTLLEPACEPTVHTVPAASLMDMWARVPPAHKAPVPTATFASGTTTQSLGSGHGSIHGFLHDPSHGSGHVPLHSGMPNAFGVKPKAEASPAALVDPFASLDIGIKATHSNSSTVHASPTATQYGSHPQYSNQMPHASAYPGMSVQKPLHQPTMTVAQSSTNPFDLFF